MPIHSVPRARLHQAVSDIESNGERIVSVAPDGPDFVLVATVTYGQRLELRTHAARVGAA